MREVRRLGIAVKIAASFLGFGAVILSFGFVIGRSAGIHIFGTNQFVVPVGGFLVWCAFALLFARFVGQRLSTPINHLSRWAGNKTEIIPNRDLARKDEIGVLARTLAEMQGKIDAEHAALQEKVATLESIRRIDRAALSSSSRSEIFDKVLQTAMELVPSLFAFIVERDPDGGAFEITASRPGAAVPGVTIPKGIILDDNIPPSLLIRFEDNFELTLNRLGSEGTAFFMRSLTGFDAGSLVFTNLPFEVSGKYFGSLILVREQGGRPLDQIRPLADQAILAIKHLETRIESEQNWYAVVMSLVRAIDAKSKWTSGHSERVANLAVAVGDRLMMDDHELTDLRISAMLHDIGKIGVPESILDKPEKLTREEMAVIREHPAIGAGIVEKVPSYEKVRSAILYHHERWDGTGYPEGLRGESIPLNARIIALADVYDAITDERPYRHGMAMGEAYDFINRGAGTLFDASLSRLFLETMEKIPGSGSSREPSELQ